MAKYTSYKEYVEAAKEFYKNRKNLKVPIELMIITEEAFDTFDGVIEFGPGSANLVNQESGCKCTPTFDGHCSPVKTVETRPFSERKDDHKLVGSRWSREHYSDSNGRPICQAELTDGSTKYSTPAEDVTCPECLQLIEDAKSKQG